MKKAYERPALQRLGKVEQLTLGGRRGDVIDAKGNRRKKEDRKGS